MLEHYLSRSDTRSKYKSALIERAILEQKSGYQYEANPCVVEFCAAMTAYQREKYPGLPTGSVAWWPGYPTLLKDTVTIFKADKGFCDLQFGHTSAQDLFARTKKYLAKRMTVVQTGKPLLYALSFPPYGSKTVLKMKSKKLTRHWQQLHSYMPCLKKLQKLT